MADQTALLEELERLEREAAESGVQIYAEEDPTTSTLRGLGPSQAETIGLADSAAIQAQPKTGITVPEFASAAYDFATDAGALQMAGLAASALAPQAGLAVKAATGLAAGLGSKRILETLPESVSQLYQTGRDLIAGESLEEAATNASPSRLLEAAELDSVDRAVPALVEDTINLGLGKVAEGAIKGTGRLIDVGATRAGAAIAPVANKIERAKRWAATQQIRAFKISPAKLKTLETSPLTGQPESGLVEAFSNLRGQGLSLSGNPLTAARQLSMEKAKVGQALGDRLELATDELVKKGQIQAGDGGALDLAEMVRKELQEIKEGLVKQGKETYLSEIDKSLDWLEGSLYEAADRARAINPNYQPSLKTLNSLKTEIYQGARYGAGNPSEHSLWVDRQLGRAIKNSIEKAVGKEGDLAKLNRYYGDLEEASSALDGPIGAYLRGDQMGISAKLQSALGVGAAGYLLEKTFEDPSPTSLATTAVVLGMGMAGLKNSPAFRRATSSFANSLIQNGYPAQLAYTYAAQQLEKTFVDSAQATPLPRSSSEKIPFEIAMPRITRSFIDQGLPPDVAMMEAFQLSKDVSSTNRVAKQRGLQALLQLAPDALEKTGSGYQSVIDGQFTDPLEQANAIRSTFDSDADLLTKAQGLSAALRGRDPSLNIGRIETTLPEADLENEVSIDLLESALKEDSFTSSLPLGPQEALSERMKSLARGTSREAY